MRQRILVRKFECGEQSIIDKNELNLIVEIRREAPAARSKSSLPYVKTLVIRQKFGIMRFRKQAGSRMHVCQRATTLHRTHSIHTVCFHVWSGEQTIFDLLLAESNGKVGTHRQMLGTDGRKVAMARAN